MESKTSWQDSPFSVLRSRGMIPKKRFGQNFLISCDTFEQMLHSVGVSPSDCVLEVGAGLGRTTRILSERAGRVVAVEIDGALADIIRANLEGTINVSVLITDVLGPGRKLACSIETQLAEASEAGMSLKLVANLPYCVAAPLIVTVLESRLPFVSLAVLVQREVAARIAARPGTKDYGPLSVFAQLWADVEAVGDLSPTSFWPRPKVHSTALALRKTQERRSRVTDYGVFSTVVKKVLQMRRKVLKNSLRGAVRADLVADVLAASGVSGSTRSDSVSIEAFIELSNAVVNTAT